MTKTIGTALAATLLLGACQKSDNTTPDAQKVTMSITSPQAGQTFHSGDTVFIKSTVSYPGELHGYEVKVTDTASNTIVYDEAQHIHDDHFTIDDQWIGTVTRPTVLKLSIIASIDHDGNQATKELFFTMQP